MIDAQSASTDSGPVLYLGGPSFVIVIYNRVTIVEKFCVPVPLNLYGEFVLNAVFVIDG